MCATVGSQLAIELRSSKFSVETRTFELAVPDRRTPAIPRAQAALNRELGIDVTGSPRGVRFSMR
jgi:hypothetical protein